MMDIDKGLSIMVRMGLINECNPYYGWDVHSTKTNLEHWTEMDADIDGLKDLIDKGYKIRINC
jgi:hypothetical protein